MARVRVAADDFDLATEISALTGIPGVGGIACFIGVVRGEVGGRMLQAMTLEHYPAMAEKAITAIAEEAERDFALLGCTVIHRVGRLLPGERIVLVLAAASHRAAALAATSFLIDWLKTRAPFWKREQFADGTARWVEAAADEVRTASWAEAP